MKHFTQKKTTGCLLCLFCSRHSSPRSSLVFLFVCFIVFPSLYREQRWETQIVKCHRPWTVWTRGGCSALPPKEPKQYPHSQPLRVHLQHNGFKAIFKSLYFHSHCIVFKPNHKLWVLPDNFTCFLYCNFILFYFLQWNGTEITCVCVWHCSKNKFSALWKSFCHFARDILLFCRVLNISLFVCLKVSTVGWWGWRGYWLSILKTIIKGL